MVAEEWLPMTESLRKYQAWLLGLLVVLGLSLAAGGLFAIGDRQQLWHSLFSVQIQLGNAGGLEIGSRVRVQGINAGQVVAIAEPEQRGGNILVTLRLDSRFRALLGADACAEVKTEGLLGGKVIDIVPGSPGAELLADGAILPGRIEGLAEDLRKLAADGQITLAEARTVAGNLKTLVQRGERTLTELEGLTHDLREGEGPLGREVIGTIKQVRQSSQTVNNSFEALKQMPLLGKHIDANTKLLVRPGMDKLVGAFEEGELFHTGRSVFHPEGVERLNAWALMNLPKSKLKGSEVVIVAYTDPNNPDSQAADLLTQEQAEAVKTYLMDHHDVHKLGYFSRRSVTALGMGIRPVPGYPISPPPPLRRIEIIIFAPAGTLS
jgi:phospholipid/cholesterol/gamma-HCH transport system substrate-binding protein